MASDILIEMRWLVLFGVALASGVAQEPGPYRIGNGVSAPVVVSKAEPEYSDEARQAAVDGTVVVSMVVDSEGNPSKLRVVRQIGFGLDEKAVAAVSTWRFKPGMKDGLAVPVRTTVEVDFRVSEERDTLHLQTFSCKPSQGASLPLVAKSEHPRAPGPGESVSVSLLFVVDEQGIPANISVLKLSDSKWETDMIDAVRQWRFRPSLAGGQPVVAHCSLSFAVGKAPERTGASRIGGDISAPRVVRKVEPNYSEEARRLRFEGTVVLSVVVDPTGAPRDLKAIRSLGLGLDQKAMEAVEQWKFQPGMREDTPVAVQASIEVNFRMLVEPGDWRLGSIAFQPPAGATRPRVTHAKFPGSSDSGQTAIVALSLVVDEQGKPRDVHADKSSDPKWERKIADLVRDWKFEPGLKDGKAVAVPCSLSLVLGQSAATSRPR